jgi:hypothetical protein
MSACSAFYEFAACSNCGGTCKIGCLISRETAFSRGSDSSTHGSKSQKLGPLINADLADKTRSSAHVNSLDRQEVPTAGHEYDSEI